MNYSQRLVYNKLISGAFRVGVSQLLVVRALSQFSELPTDVIAHRLMGDWTPSAEFFNKLTSHDLEPEETVIARPYPFHLAHQIDFTPEELGKVSEWQAEWKWDGIRAQVIKRADEVFIWSRGEDLMTERFPEVADAAYELPNGTVLDGELLPWRDGRVLPFLEMQRRIGRKNLSAKILAEVPVILQCYDLLEYEGRDIRSFDFKTRREFLETRPRQSERRRKTNYSPDRISSSDQLETLGKAPRKKSLARRRGLHAEASRFPVSCRPTPRRLVEVEGRPADRRLRADLRSKRLRKTL
jgi:DNA ligase-1